MRKLGENGGANPPKKHQLDLFMVYRVLLEQL